MRKVEGDFMYATLSNPELRRHLSLLSTSSCGLMLINGLTKLQKLDSGVAITVVVPFFSGKWASLLKLKNEVETAVETVEEIVEAVEKVAEGVEKVAEDIADDLPEGGRLRKAVDFVESVAERASKDAHLVGDFIDKVQEVEERVEEYVESLAEESTTHDHPIEEQEKAHEPPNQEISDVDAHKHH
ncbi:hypothetical protein Sango_2164100 [Sesamum angolense]|uniref:Uncharacterized protein n=1 Tax=Sesamum angolense TaxID=2727404 RepID=A0AAE2BMQ8_9LAMI|nr:hypothetical protein Sango_2164100 [Sesamum angolense]